MEQSHASYYQPNEMLRSYDLRTKVNDSVNMARNSNIQ
jgi:hypothetical protein